MKKLILALIAFSTLAFSAKADIDDDDVEQIKSDLEDVKTQLQDIQDELDPPVYTAPVRRLPNYVLTPVDAPRVVSESEKKATELWRNGGLRNPATKPYPWQYPHETMPSYQARLSAWENGETQPAPETRDQWIARHRK